MDQGYTSSHSVTVRLCLLTNTTGRTALTLYTCLGEVFHMTLFGQSIVVLDSYEAANELLEKRSANYSDRPESTMTKLCALNSIRFNPMMLTRGHRTGYADWVLVLMQYGQQWREHRRAIHRSFHPEVVSQYNHVQEEVTRALLRDLLESPEAFIDHLGRYVPLTTSTDGSHNLSLAHSPRQS